MIWTGINIDNTIFNLISFEGPDILEQIVESLIQRLEYQAKIQGLITPSRINRVSQAQEVSDVKPMSFHRRV
jgi:hypothetical protein